MTKAEIAAMAVERARQLRERFGSPQTIHLAAYASDADLRLLRPEDGAEATAKEHRAIVDAVCLALRKDGHLVVVETIDALEYLDWLKRSGYCNDAARRAQWLALKAEVTPPSKC